MLDIRPVAREEADTFIRAKHRHHGVPTGAEAVAVFTEGNMIVVPGYGVTNETRDEFVAAQRTGFNVVPWESI